MNARRFTGATSREVLAKVREVLGPDAMILSNRGTPGGMEVVAVAPHEVSVERAAPAAARASAGHSRTPLTTLLRQRKNQPVRNEPAWPAAVKSAAAPPPLAPVVATPEAKATPAVHTLAANVMPAAFTPAANVRPADMPPAMNARPAAITTVADRPTAMNGVLAEIKSMRDLLKRELSALGYSNMEQRDPGGMAALRELLGAGFSPVLARGVVKGLPPCTNMEDALRQVRERIEHHLPLAEADTMIERGGVYALLGPTGAGKTTSVAKLAARAVVRHGAKRVALLTSDSYRIAGFDQLRVYARILGVSVEPVRDANSVSRALASLKDKHLVLIDTAGTSQRDDMVGEQAAMFAAGGVQRLLLLNATCGTATIDDVVTTYRRHGIEGAIVTKTDEAASLAAVVECLLRHKLPLHYVTNGQRVPEDLHLPNAGWLVRRALKLASCTVDYKPAAEDLPLMMSGGQGA